MFDVFQNVLFGKKKSSGEADKSSEGDKDDFVTLDYPTDQPQRPSVDRTYPPLNYQEYQKQPASKKEEVQAPIMPLQNVPFTINPALHSSAKLDEIWQAISQSLSAISSFRSVAEDYDFSLEKSVIAETTHE